MSKAVRVTTSIPASNVVSDQSDQHQFVSIALFCGLGLLASLVLLMLGVQFVLS